MMERIRDRPARSQPDAVLRPAQHQRVEAAGDLDEPRARRRMEWRPRMPSRLARDDPALLHQRLAGQQAALPVLVIDEREPALVTSDRGLAPPCREVVDDA